MVTKQNPQGDSLRVDNKKGRTADASFFITDKTGDWLFAQVDSLRGANTCTSAALGAGFGVDRILVTFRDCAYRTLVNASSASDAVVTNYVSHFCCSFKLIVQI